MKTCRHLLAALLVLLPACGRQEFPSPDPEPAMPQLVMHTLYAALPGDDAPESKTALSPTNDKKILWGPHEAISVLSGSGNYMFTGDNDSAASSASFTGEGPADLGSYVALYPYNASASYDGTYVSTTLPANQTGQAGSFADGYLITADDAVGDNISLNHLCSGLRFMVSSDQIKSVSIRGNNGEMIAGDFRFRFTAEDTPEVEAGSETVVTLTAPGGGTFETGKYYYIVMLPSVFSKGLTLTADNGTQVGELSFGTSITCKKGAFKNITGNLDTRMSWSDSKSQVYYGSENSFCLRPGGTVSFDVSPRQVFGTWQRSGLPATAPVPNSAEVLWGSSTASLSGTTLTVTASSTPGSSLVAIKNGSTILWSYLIWVTASEPASIDLPSGAKLQEPLGGELYFQWGRKDPLVAGCSFFDNQGDNGLTFSIQHPTQYINGGSSTYDWYTNNTWNFDDCLWGDGGRKTVWDPCPEGWKVPSWSVFSGLSEADARFTDIGFISNNAAQYPGLTYWTATPDEAHIGFSCAFSNQGGGEYDYEGDARYLGAPVRCVKEN